MAKLMIFFKSYEETRHDWVQILYLLLFIFYDRVNTVNSLSLKWQDFEDPIKSMGFIFMFEIAGFNTHSILAHQKVRATIL